MPSHVPGFEYDIFISYRHNDNRSGWVTDFVKNLREELAATIKEPVSVYFDANPHDGLLETHDVGKSLEGKLRSLIFIPILSQTYCDENSFAWRHEFLPFHQAASSDSLGHDIRLPNGNVASRILPIQIHELDDGDRALLENTTQQKLRAIEFIYSSPGVNRPLTVGDNADKNQKQTFYRDQVNKVANAVKALLAGMRPAAQPPAQNIGSTTAGLSKKKQKKLAFVSLVAIALASAFILVYTLTGKDIGNASEVDRSIAILPFEDISAGRDQAYLVDGFMIEVMDHLTKFQDLRVIPRSTMLAYRDARKTASQIGGELSVATLLDGSFRKIGESIKITVSLIDTRNEKTRWQKTYDVKSAEIFAVQSEIAEQVARSLHAAITPEVQSRIVAVPTNNTEAYDLYLKGRNVLSRFWLDFNPAKIDSGILYMEKAVALDSAFSNGFAGLGSAWWMHGHFARKSSPDDFERARRYLKRAIVLDPFNGWAYSELAVVQDNFDWDREAALQSLLKARALNPGDAAVLNHLGSYYYRTENCTAYEQVLQDAIRLFGERSHGVAGGKFYLMICKQDYQGMRERKEQLWPEASQNPVAGMMFLTLTGDYDGAIRFGTDENGNPREPLLPHLGEVYAMAGQRDKAKEVIRILTQSSNTRRSYIGTTAPIWMALGEEDRAYELLEKCLTDPDRAAMPPLIAYSPALILKRNDPRFRKFLDRAFTPVKRPG